MAILTLPFLWGLLVLLAQWTLAATVPRSISNCELSTFSSALKSAVSALNETAIIERVDYVADGGTYGEGAKDLGYPTNATDLPELCAVIVNVTSSPTSYYRLGLFFPSTDTYTGRFLTIGNGGFLGGINWRDMGPGVKYGFAVVSTDTGHNSSNGDLTWAYEKPEKVVDLGWRATHGAVEVGKALTVAFYGESIVWSYYSGCSMGGRQGLKEIQINPNAFDGAIIGAPAWDPAGLMPWLSRLGPLDLPATNTGAFTTDDQLSLLSAAVRKQCDPQDGVTDDIISSPETCKPNFKNITCGNPGVNASACLTAEQIKTANTIWTDYKLSDGTLVYNGFNHGSEDQWDIYQLYGNPENFDQQWPKYILYNDLSWTWENFTDQLAVDARHANPGNATADGYDISAFRGHGGKIILYHGEADGYISTRSSQLFYNRTKAAVGGDMDDFFRYFLIPGMQHCWLSTVNAPWMMSGLSQQVGLGAYANGYSVPGFMDKEHDAVLALMDWVENGTAIESVIATSWNISTGTLQPSRQRPICKWPTKAVYNGTGAVGVAANWHCA
jgi:feruloyl esterase